MRERNERRGEKGFVLLIGLFVAALVTTYITSGFTRSMGLMLDSSRAVAHQQAFSQAEAALDDAMSQMANQSSAQINQLLSGTTSLACALPGCTIAVKDNDENETDEPVQNLAVDSDRIVIVETSATSATGNLTRLVAFVQLPGSVFDYGLLGYKFWMYDHTSLGSAGDPATGTPANLTPILLTRKLDTHDHTKVHSTNVSFLSGSPYCPSCYPSVDVSVFPETAASDVHVNAALLPTTITTLDLNPYYNKAIEQCIAQGNTQASCEDGSANSVHHVTANTTLQNTTVDGVIYVEKGVNLILDGTVTIHGTIVHEGYDNHAGYLQAGVLDVRPTAHLTVDSYAANGITGESAFAPGLAIVGGAWLDTDPPETAAFDIKGFVIAGGPEVGTPLAINGSGTIDGGLVSICEFSNQVPNEVLGPGTGPIEWFQEGHGLHEVTLGPGTVRVLYHQPANMPPGFRGAIRHPRILSWQECKPGDPSPCS